MAAGGGEEGDHHLTTRAMATTAAHWEEEDVKKKSSVLAPKTHRVNTIIHDTFIFFYSSPYYFLVYGNMFCAHCNFSRVIFYSSK